MSDYFDSTVNRVSVGSLAQSSQVNAVRDEVGVGFDKLPTPTQISAGMVSFATDTGGANAYAVAMPKTQTSYITGLMVRFNPANTNTAASTLNVDSLGVKSIKRPDGTDVQAGDIVAGQIVELTYNGTNFVFTGSFPVSLVTDASTYAALAEDWATEAEDVVVADGKYSAYHWAQKAIVDTNYHIEEFTSSGTFTKPSDVDTVDIWLVGGGASGGYTTTGACGGGGGQIVIRRHQSISGDLTITLGTGGAPKTTSAYGNDGGDSTISGGVALTAAGGEGSVPNSVCYPKGGGNESWYYNDQPNYENNQPLIMSADRGCPGGNGGASVSTYSRTNGQSISGYGDGGISNGSTNCAGGGGASYGNGGDGGYNGNGSAGVKGGGGGGCVDTGSAGYSSGAGGDGYCIIGYRYR